MIIIIIHIIIGRAGASPPSRTTGRSMFILVYQRVGIRESVDSLSRDGTDAQEMRRT